jgi:16S rRNA (guanine527-N7)-methyltransferase
VSSSFPPEPPTEQDSPAVLALARDVFGVRFPLAERYADLLCTDGVVAGVIGPREAPRVWSRHLLNSAALAQFVPPDTTVVDVGSGAGLPGIPLALARADLSVQLLEPLLRRCRFLESVTGRLDLGSSVLVRRGRAPEAARDLDVAVDVAVARAVAPLDKLTSWSLPLLRPGGLLLALRGQSARSEVEEAKAAIAAAGGGEVAVREVSLGAAIPPTTVVSIRRVQAKGRRPGSTRGRKHR